MPIGPARLRRTAPRRRGQPRRSSAPGSPPSRCFPLAVLARAAWRVAAPGAAAPLGVAEPIRRQSRPSRLATALTRAGSVTGGAGVAMAFEPGHGRTAVPVRTALAGTASRSPRSWPPPSSAPASIGLVGTPGTTTGRTGYQEVDFKFGTSRAQAGQHWRRRSPAISGYAAGDYGAAHHRRRDRARDRPRPGARQRLPHAAGGRAPAGPDEIALGDADAARDGTAPSARPSR